MKATTFLAIAASISGAVATFKKAPKFNCPKNTDNKCDDKQKSGFDWLDLTPGDFNNYHGFNFKGFKCEDKFDKRNPHLSPRTGRKAVTGRCGRKKEVNPSFGCEKVDKFSIDLIDISVEFDTDLEFHYDMPGGGKCKHRSRCSKNGSTVKNTQCGGAKNVTIVYPPPPNPPKEECDIAVHEIKFDCNPPETPKQPPAQETTTSQTTTSPQETATETEETATSEETTTTTTTEEEEAETTQPPAAETTETGETSTSSVDATTEETSVDATTAETSSVETTEIVETETTVHQTTSTIFTTTVQTVTSCRPEIPECPKDKPTDVAVVTMTIPVTTTVCPVTETITKTRKTEKPSNPKPTEETSANNGEQAESTTTTEAPQQTEQPETPKTPEQPLPCPEVVPSCLNTWMFTVACLDNTDTACFCPDTEFVQNIFTCIYAYGEDDAIVSEAISYFQGICAQHAPENPAIVTGAETITTVITATAQPTVPAQYTTVVVTATEVVPCTTDGTTIEGSSTTQVTEQTVTVPEVGFQTGTAGEVDIIPTTPEAVVEEPGSTPNTIVTVPTAAGTGGVTPTSSNTPVQFTGAATKAGSGIALGLALVAAVAVF